MISNDIPLYTQTHVIRETSSGHRGEPMQRSTSRHYAEKESKLEVSIGSLPLKLKEPRGRGEGKIVGVRGHGGFQENMAH